MSSFEWIFDKRVRKEFGVDADRMEVGHLMPMEHQLVLPFHAYEIILVGQVLDFHFEIEAYFVVFVAVVQEEVFGNPQHFTGLGGQPCFFLHFALQSVFRKFEQLAAPAGERPEVVGRGFVQEHLAVQHRHAGPAHQHMA